MSKITSAQIALTSRQLGWTYTTNGGGASTSNVTVTFPTAFATTPKVTVGLLGFKTGGAPTVITDFTGVYTIAVGCFAVSISTSGFTVYTVGTANFGASFNGVSWIAEV